MGGCKEKGRVFRESGGRGGPNKKQKKKKKTTESKGEKGRKLYSNYIVGKVV